MSLAPMMRMKVAGFPVICLAVAASFFMCSFSGSLYTMDPCANNSTSMCGTDSSFLSICSGDSSAVYLKSRVASATSGTLFAASPDLMMPKLRLVRQWSSFVTRGNNVCIVLYASISFSAAFSPSQR